MLGDGMGDNYMVTRITMVLLNVQLQIGVGVTYTRTKGKKVNLKLVFHIVNHLLCSLPMLREQLLVVKMDYQLAQCFKTGKEHIARISYKVYGSCSQILRIGQKVNNRTGV